MEKDYLKECPECGKKNVQVIDNGYDFEIGEYYKRVICPDCGADYHVSVMSGEVI